MLQRRAAQTTDEVARASSAVRAHVAELVQVGALVAVYSALPSEVDPVDFAALAGRGVRLVWPRVAPRRALEFLDGRPEVPGPFGIRQPARGRVVDPAEIDLIVVPGLAFDRRGGRLGVGAGYYDRFLPLLRPDTLVVGVGFDWQLVPFVPREAHDAPVHCVLTPSHHVRCP
jgi:5-formyltetrahydrofolate cyclo-ligase